MLESPFGDAGYDFTDFCKIAPRYGTNAKRLFDAAHGGEPAFHDGKLTLPGLACALFELATQEPAKAQTAAPNRL